MENSSAGKFKSNFNSYLEIFVPVILHFFDISIVEVLIRARLYYPVSHDFASVCFVMSMALLFNHNHKKLDPKQKEFSFFQIGAVSLFCYYNN